MSLWLSQTEQNKLLAQEERELKRQQNLIYRSKKYEVGKNGITVQIWERKGDPEYGHNSKFLQGDEAEDLKLEINNYKMSKGTSQIFDPYLDEFFL